MKRTLLHKLCLVALGLLGCGEPLEPGAKVDSLRVLAEQADLPFAQPGETVQLRSLSHDPAGRPIIWAWLSCLNPPSSDLEGCLTKIADSPEPMASVFALGEGMDAAELTIPSDALTSLPPAARAAATVGVVSVACPGDLTFEAGPGGLPFRCREPETAHDLGLDEFIVGLKRISVRESDRNTNPAITAVTFDGADWPEDEVKDVGFCTAKDFDYAACSDAEKHELAVRISTASFESGSDEHGRPFEEQLVVQFYATEGIFESEVRIGDRSKNGWVARERASGQVVTLWFVARDNRGGVTWTQRQVQVR